MQKFTLALLVAALISCSPAQTTFSQPRTSDSLNVFPDGYDAAEACRNIFDLTPGNGVPQVDFPARFPEAARTRYLVTSYQLNCPDFSVVSIEQKSMTFTGVALRDLDTISRKGPTTDDYVFWVLSAGSNYVTQKLEFGEDGVLRVLTQDGQPLSTDLVVAFRQGTGVLQPLAFNGVATPLRYDADQNFDIYVAPEGRWTHLHWDSSKRQAVFEFNTVFPKS